MNFLLYLLSLFLFYLFFWHLLSLITCLPGLGMASFVLRLSDKGVKRRTSMAVFVLTHIVSVTLNTWIIASGVSWITIGFIYKTNSLWLYSIAGGIAVLASVGSPGREEVHGFTFLEGLGFYILLTLAALGNNVAYILNGIFLWVIVLSGIIGFIVWLVMRKSISGKYVKCPFCKKWLVPSGDSTKPYTCKCGAFAEWEEPHVLRFTKGDLSRTVSI